MLYHDMYPWMINFGPTTQERELEREEEERERARAAAVGRGRGRRRGGAASGRGRGGAPAGVLVQPSIVSAMSAASVAPATIDISSDSESEEGGEEDEQ